MEVQAMLVWSDLELDARTLTVSGQRQSWVAA
jgi:hypothetical protein